MEKVISVKIILKYMTTRIIYEEVVILIRIKEGEKIMDKCKEYVQIIQNDLGDEQFVELDEVIDFCELNDTFGTDFQFKEIYSSFMTLNT